MSELSRERLDDARDALNQSACQWCYEYAPDLLAEVDRLRGYLADAWDEGFDAGEKDAFSHQTFNEPCIPNPYRKGQS